MSTSTSYTGAMRRMPTHNKGRGFPIVIAEWPRNSRGELARIVIDRYKGHFVVDVRSWWRDDKGVFRPNVDGFSLSIEHLPKLASGVVSALRRAEEFGLLE